MKIPISILCVVFLATASHAQTIIPFAGISFSSNTYALSSGFGETETRDLAGLTAGVGFEFPIAPKLSLLAEARYVSKGHNLYFRNAYDDIVQTADVDFRHNYIELPVHVKAYFLDGSVQLFVNAGGYMGVGLGGTVKGRSEETESGTVLYYTEFDGKIKYGDGVGNQVDDDYYYSNRMDYGLSFGGGAVLFKRISVDIRYDLGLVDIDEDEGDFKNRSLQLTVGVPLHLGSE